MCVAPLVCERHYSKALTCMLSLMLMGTPKFRALPCFIDDKIQDRKMKEHAQITQQYLVKAGVKPRLLAPIPQPSGPVLPDPPPRGPLCVGLTSLPLPVPALQGSLGPVCRCLCGCSLFTPLPGATGWTSASGEKSLPGCDSALASPGDVLLSCSEGSRRPELCGPGFLSCSSFTFYFLFIQTVPSPGHPFSERQVQIT